MYNELCKPASALEIAAYLYLQPGFPQKSTPGVNGGNVKLACTSGKPAPTGSPVDEKD